MRIASKKAAKSSNKLTFKLKLGFFPCFVVVAIGHHWKEIPSVAKRYKLDLPDLGDWSMDNYAGCCYPCIDNHSLIWLEGIPDTAVKIALVAHEANHAMLSAMRFLGMPSNESTEEVLCYGTQFLVEEILRAANK